MENMALMAIAASRESEKMNIYTDSLTSRYMWVVVYDQLLWQIIQIHDLVTDELSYQVQFVEGIVVNPFCYVEIANDGTMELCEVEEEDINSEEGDN